MAGLDPAIHSSLLLLPLQNVDPRVKPAGDAVCGTTVTRPFRSWLRLRTDSIIFAPSTAVANTAATPACRLRQPLADGARASLALEAFAFPGMGVPGQSS